MSRVSVKGLRKSFGTHEVLRGVDLEVNDAEILAVLGPSGCGKTTLLRILAGFLEPDAGVVALDGATVADGRGSLPAWRRRVGYVPQEGALFPHLDVCANILFGLPRRERTDQRLAEMLQLAGLPTTVARAYPRELSGGQQQRVALARALAPGPRVVLLDEPFSSLDAALRLSTGREVTAVLRNAGSTALLVTHDQGEALSLADRVAVMDDGVVRQVDSPARLYGAPADQRVGRFVGDANLIAGELHGDKARCVLGTVNLSARPMGGDGTPVTLLVRPEQLRIVPAVSSDPGSANGRVDEVVFYGPHASVRLSLADGTILQARVDPAMVPAVGDQVRVEVTGVSGVFA
jgi:iron(III) transport system ATP-binding protein